MKVRNYTYKLRELLYNKDRLITSLSSHGILKSLSDEEFLRRMWRLRMNYELDLDNPKTFNEKIQWLKLYDRNPLYTELVDKYNVKKYVEKVIGKKYVIPVVGGAWKSANEIDFSELPDRFVLKCNHDCGSVVICNEKKDFNYKLAKNKLNKALKKNYYLQGREWPYKNVEPCIFAEEYMEDESGYELKDYKFFCFDGVPKMMFVASDRMSIEETKFDFFDMEFNQLPFTNGHPNSSLLPKRPHYFDEMKELASKLSAGIPHVRVDFYETNNNVYFGEMTFYHWGGMVQFDPIEWDYIIGKWIKLPERKM